MRRGRIVVVTSCALVLFAALGVWVVWPWLLAKEGGRSLVASLSGRLLLPLYGEPALEPRFDGLDVERAHAPVRLVRVADGLVQPTDIVRVPGYARRFLVAGKRGRCEWVDLDRGTRGLLFEVAVEDRVEMGLLSVALHPRFAENDRLFVHYNPALGGALRTRLVEMKVTRDAGGAPIHATEVATLLELEQPYDNHDGGQLLFGPDGMLYLGLGDGGSGGDPHGYGQDRTTWLAKILRLDVDHRDEGRAYAVPKDNPFVGDAGTRPEIWALGVRNPWRFTFDPRGRMVVADVGQNLWEEVSLAQAGDNLGWNQREANTCYAAPRDGSACANPSLREPFYVYGRKDGQSITGGVVYTGRRLPALRGRYLFADFAHGRLWAVPLPETLDGGIARDAVRSLGRFAVLISAFATDAAGEVFVTDFGGGSIYRLSPMLEQSP